MNGAVYICRERGKGMGGIVCIECIFLMYFAVFFFSSFFFFECCFVLRCVCVCVRMLYNLVLYATLLFSRCAIQRWTVLHSVEL